MTKPDDDRPAPPAEKNHDRPAEAPVETNIDRRAFLKIVGVAGAAAAVPAAAAELTPPAAHSMAGMQMAQATVTPVATATAGPAKTSWMFLNGNEAAFIEAAVDTLIPKDTVGPGGIEAGVAVYIDRQLAGAYGKGDRLYDLGPFAEDATPQQGYQLPFTPAELIRTGIADVDALALKTKNNVFSQLAAADRSAIISDLDQNKVKLATVPTATFFNLLLQLTQEGYFADPMYGGNKDKAVWAMLGFPGAIGMYVDKILPYRNKPYVVAPQSIADLS
jgi:gluconate 2-dehydrogenase gamma chain